MNAKYMLTKGLVLTLLSMIGVGLATPAHAAEPKPFSEVKRLDSNTIVESYETSLQGLEAERAKYRVGKSTLFVVSGMAKQVLESELQMSTTAAQRVAAYTRFGVLVRWLEKEASSPLERVMVARIRQDTDANLANARRDLR